MSIAVHISFTKCVHPAYLLALLRRIRRPGEKVTLVSFKPTIPEQDNYLRLFEEFSPVIQNGTEEEDLRVLSAADRIVCSRSNFSLSVVSDAEKWIPEGLGVEFKGHTYEAPPYDFERLSLPGKPEYVCGEFYMQLCDYVVISDAKKEELGPWHEIGAPPERQLNIADTWSTAGIRTLFVHNEEAYLSKVKEYAWPSLKLLILAGGDITVFHGALESFLEAHPQLYVWKVNNLEASERVRTLPIGLENTKWRELRPSYEALKFWRSTEREHDILMPHCRPFCKLRSEWSEAAQTSLRDFERFYYCRGFYPHSDYMDTLRNSKAVICPPGNGVDTHRHWEVLAAGAWMILHKNPHTDRLLAEYPSLPIRTIADIEEIRELPAFSSPAPFHPLLLTEYWRILRDSHLL